MKILLTSLFIFCLSGPAIAAEDDIAAMMPKEAMESGIHIGFNTCQIIQGYPMRATNIMNLFMGVQPYLEACKTKTCVKDLLYRIAEDPALTYRAMKEGMAKNK
jgi:hypothetical protein